MAASPRFKVYRGEEYVASVKYVEDAAAILAMSPWAMWLWVVIGGAAVLPVRPALGASLLAVGVVLAIFEVPTMRRTGRHQGIGARLLTLVMVGGLSLAVAMAYGLVQP